MSNNKYSSALTGSGFMMYEFKQLALLKLQGLTDQEIRQKVLDENIFQYNTTTGIERAFPYLLKRINTLDKTLLEMTVNEEVQIGKLINIYSIMKIDRLFYEFLFEVISEKLKSPENILEKKDINVFFNNKMDQSEFVDSLAESTVARLKSQFLTILSEVGILKNRRTGEMERIFIPHHLKQHLIDKGDHHFVSCLGNGRD